MPKPPYDPWLSLSAARPDTCTLRQLHGVIQVAMGWEGVHLFQFCLRSRRYGSWQLSASSPDVTLAALKLRRGARFMYEYDLNIPWRHEVRIEEDRLEAEPGKSLPRCAAGNGACPPEDCGGPRGYLAGLDEASSWEAFEDGLVTAKLCACNSEYSPDNLNWTRNGNNQMRDVVSPRPASWQFFGL